MSVWGNLKHLKNTYQLFSARKDLADPQRRELALAQIQRVLETERGLLQKIAQFLSLSSKSDSALLGVYQLAPVLKLEDLMYAFETIFSEEFAKHWQPLEQQAGAASLSQVFFLRHKHSQQEYVAKLQIPGIGEEIRSQLKLLGLLPQLGPAKKFAVDIDAYKRMLLQMLESELDYSKEQERIEQIYPWFQDAPDILTPKLFPEFRNPNLYFQTALPGRELVHYLSPDSLSAATRVSVAKSLWRFHVRCFLRGSLLQTDGNYGNYRLFLQGPQPVLSAYDFGAMHEFGKDFRLALLRLYLAAKQQGSEDLWPLLVGLGFDLDKLASIEVFIPKLWQSFLEPFVSAKIYDLRSWRLPERLDALLGEQKWWFRSAGGEDFFLLMKALHGMLELIRGWQVGICFSEILDQELLPYLPEVLAWQPPFLEARGQPSAFAYLAEKLRVSVHENGKLKVRVELPIRVVEKIEEYMDPELLQKLAKQGISHQQRVQEFLAKGARPGPIFQLQEASKEYRVEAI